MINLEQAGFTDPTSPEEYIGLAVRALGEEMKLIRSMRLLRFLEERIERKYRDLISEHIPFTPPSLDK